MGTRFTKRLIIGAAALTIAGFASWACFARPYDTAAEKAKPTPVADVISAPPASATVQAGRRLADELSAAFEHAATAIKPSVVPVLSEKDAEMPSFGPFGPDFFQRFFGRGDGNPFGSQGDEERPLIQGMGSGVIISEDGYILTNNHVAGEADRLWVLIDKERVEAKVVGTDRSTDLAVIKVDRRGLPAAKLGDSDSVKTGEWVIAVGNPYELLHTVTAGIVSATSRDTVGLAEYEDFIQTDASINPGNSGGALANLDGEVVGINTAISSPSGGNVGIGFAIPINLARDVMNDLIHDGSVSRGYLSLVPQDIDSKLAKAMGLRGTEGALVADVTPDGPADKAGIETGDVIVRFDHKAVEDSRSLRRLVAAADPGERVEVDVVRDGKDKAMKVELGERPDEEASVRSGGERSAVDRFGLHLQTLTPELADRMGVEPGHGAVVGGVDPRSDAAHSGLRQGDIIERVDGRDVTSAAEVEKALQSSDGPVALRIRRGDVRLFIGIEPSH